MRTADIADGEIRLGQFLKLAGLVASGSDAKQPLAAGLVTVNDEVETRRGRRLRPGDVVVCGSEAVQVATTGKTGQTGALFELGDPGPMRDRLVASVLRGEKTATTSLEVFYTIGGMRLPRPGDRSTLVGSAGQALGLVEVTDTAMLRVGDVGDDVACAEGEGFRDAAAWRRAHELYWSGFVGEIRSRLGDESWVLDDDTPVVVEWFRLVDPGGDAPGPGIPASSSRLDAFSSAQ